MYVKLSRLQAMMPAVRYVWMANIRAKDGRMMVEGEVTEYQQSSLEELRRLFPEDARFLQAIVTDHLRSSHFKAELVQD